MGGDCVCWAHCVPGCLHCGAKLSRSVSGRDRLMPTSQLNSVQHSSPGSYLSGRIELLGAECKTSLRLLAGSRPDKRLADGLNSGGRTVGDVTSLMAESTVLGSQFDAQLKLFRAYDSNHDSDSDSDRANKPTCYHSPVVYWPSLSGLSLR